MKRLCVLVFAGLVGFSANADVNVKELAAGDLQNEPVSMVLKSGVDASSGDMFAFAYAVNKKSDIPLLNVVSLDGGAVQAATSADASRAASTGVRSYEVTAPGTFNFSIKKSGNGYVTYSVYHIRSGLSGGKVVELGSDSFIEGPDVDDSGSLSYGTATKGQSGVVVEAASSYMTVDSAGAVENRSVWNNSRKRGVGYAEMDADSAAWVTEYRFSVDSPGKGNRVLSGIAFGEMADSSAVAQQPVKQAVQTAEKTVATVKEVVEEAVVAAEKTVEKADSEAVVAGSDEEAAEDETSEEAVRLGLLGGLSAVIVFLFCRRSE
jgi:hypothetical protein